MFLVALTSCSRNALTHTRCGERQAGRCTAVGLQGQLYRAAGRLHLQSNAAAGRLDVACCGIVPRNNSARTDGHAQYSYQVRFKDIENANNLPQVECGNNFPRDSEDAACQSCSAACGVNKHPRVPLENVFQIATTEVNLFNGLDEDVTVCEVEDITATESTWDNDFRIELKTKSTTFNAPEGHIISLRSNEDFSVNGVWNIKSSTSIAGQYIVSVQRKQAKARPAGLAPLSTADFVTSPFEISDKSQGWSTNRQRHRHGCIPATSLRPLSPDVITVSSPLALPALPAPVATCRQSWIQIPRFLSILVTGTTTRCGRCANQLEW